jgi:hypothetical protein
MQVAYPCDCPIDGLDVVDPIITWENHDEIVEIFRRADSIAVKISELWQVRKGSRLRQEDVDFLVELLGLQAHLSETLSRV